MKKIFNILALTAVAFSLQSCLHDDEETFSTPAAQRIQESVEATKTLLTSSPNGWLLEYYTGSDYSGPGMTMLMRFDDSKVYISSDTFEPTDMSSSTWDVKKDQGVVISVDTYNEILHTFSTPSSSALDGYEADYEFVVLSRSQDSIVVRGKKWGNRMVMTRMGDDTTWEDYLTKSQETDSCLAKYYQTLGNTTLTVNASSRRITTDDDATGTAYIPTPTGIKFPTPYSIDGKQVSSMTLDSSTRNLQCDELGAVSVKIVPLSTMIQSGEWYLTAEGMSSSVSTYFSYMIMGMSSYSCEPGFVCFGKYWSTRWGMNIALVQGTTVYASYADYDLEAVNDSTIMLSNGALDYIGNGQLVYESMYGQYVFDMFGLDDETSTWKLSTDDPARPSYIRFQNAKNVNQYFRVLPTTVYYPFSE